MRPGPLAVATMARGVILGTVGLLLLSLALTPLADGGPPLDMVVGFDRERYAIGETATVTIVIHHGLRPSDADGPVQVQVVSSTRVYNAEQVDRGTYRLTFPVDVRDGLDYGGLLVVRAYATVRGVAVKSGAVAQVLRPLTLAVALSDRHPPLGGVVNITAEARFGGGLADPQGLSIQVQPPSPGASTVVLPAQRASPGRYYGLFVVPADATGNLYVTVVEAYTGPVDVAVAEVFSVPGWLAWAHLLRADAWGTDLDAWVADAGGRAAPGVNVTLEARQDAAVVSQNNTTDRGGRAGFHLPFNGTAPLALGGWLAQGERRQPLAAFPGSVHAEPRGLRVVPREGDILQGWIPSGRPITRTFLVLLDGAPTSSSRVLVSGRTGAGEFLRGWFNTDRAGVLDLTLTPPRGPLGLRFTLSHGTTTVEAAEGFLGMDPDVQPVVGGIVPGASATVTVSVTGMAGTLAHQPTARIIVLLGPGTLLDQVWAWHPLTILTGLEILTGGHDGPWSGSMVLPEFLPTQGPYVLRAIVEDQDELLTVHANGILLQP